MCSVFRFTLILCLAFVSGRAFAEPLPAKKNNERKVIKTTQPSLSFALGPEVRYYHYTEPGYVDHSGFLGGIWGEWLWDSFVGKGKLYGYLLSGSLDYNGGLCDTNGSCTPYQSKTTDIISKINTRLDWAPTSGLGLFAGLGYRFLYDKGEGVGFYQRLGQWVYIPVGANLHFNTDIGKIIFEAEYDQVVAGLFKSNLSEVSSSYPDITHHQDQGYGIVINVGLEFGGAYKLFAYYETWDLAQSEAVQAGSSSFIEPKNNSESTGLKFGFMF